MALIPPESVRRRLALKVLSIGRRELAIRIREACEHLSRGKHLVDTSGINKTPKTSFSTPSVAVTHSGSEQKASTISDTL